MKAYKGFDKNMQCRGFQYEEGKTYETDEAILCKTGFHACTRAVDVLNFYPPDENKYHEVELEDVSEEEDIFGTSKRVAKKITIGKKLEIDDLINICIEQAKENNALVKRELDDADHIGEVSISELGNAVSGYSGISIAKYYNRAAIAGSDGVAISGEFGLSVTKNDGISISGSKGISISGGCWGVAKSDVNGIAVTGVRGKAIANDGGVSISIGGSSSTGKNGIAIAYNLIGTPSYVKGDIGSLLIVLIYDDDNNNIIDRKTTVVDGITIKANTWYTLVDGEFVETKEE